MDPVGSTLAQRGDNVPCFLGNLIPKTLLLQALWCLIFLDKSFQCPRSLNGWSWQKQILQLSCKCQSSRSPGPFATDWLWQKAPSVHFTRFFSSIIKIQWKPCYALIQIVKKGWQKDSAHVMSCVKTCSDLIAINGITLKWFFFHQFELRVKYPSERGH